MAANEDSNPGSGVSVRIGDALDDFAQRIPAATAVVFGSDRLSYAELKRRVDNCAMALLRAGLCKGDRVAMLCSSRTEFWVVFLATTKIGGIWVGLNPRYRLNEMRYVLADSQPKVLFALSTFDGRSYKDDVAILGREIPAINHVIGIGGDLGPGNIDFEYFLAPTANHRTSNYAAACDAVSARDPAAIVYTSGTTGSPKGAVISHCGVTCGAIMQATHLAVERPALVVNFPINHVACIADTCATTYVKGGKIVFQERFDPGATLAAIQAERCTVMGGVPTMLQMMLAHPDFGHTDLSSVELVAWGGAAMPRDGIVELAKLPARLMAVYGMTETCTNVTYSEEGSSIEVLAETIGKPDSGIGCRIVDKAGEKCIAELSGELQFKADFLMLGYWNNPNATAAAFTADGWLRTGDIAAWLDDGNIKLVGRLSEMFKSGGYNVYPKEIEIVLESIPGVAMAAVVGIPDEMYQEVGHAYVLPAAGKRISEHQLRDTCRKKLANYKIPKAFSIREDLPLLSVGKIDKKRLAATWQSSTVETSR